MNEQYLIERIREGVFSLSNLSTPRLQQMIMEAQSQELKDLLGCEYMYRRK